MPFETVNSSALNTAAPSGDLQPESAQNDQITQQKPDINNISIQPKLTVGAPDDPYEREADDVADKVMRMPEKHFIQRKEKKEEEETIRRKPEEENEDVHLKRNSTSSFIQKKCKECEKEEKIDRKAIDQKITPVVQTKSEGGVTVDNNIANSIQSSQGGGSTLDGSTNSFMSSRFGSDFTHVKIHTDSQAIQLNRDLNARAFTVGNDIYFNEKQYEPDTLTGKKLLAHELTHTLQQGSVQRTIQRVPAGMQSPYTGYVIPSHAAIRDHASASANVIVSIPRDQQVFVLSYSGADWLNVQVTFNGHLYLGFTHRTNIARTQDFTNTTDTGNVYTSQLAFENDKIVISKRINFINGGGFASTRRFNRLKRRFIQAIHNFLNSKYSVHISSAGGRRASGDGSYHILVRAIDDTSGPYSVTLMGGVHGRSFASTAGGTFYELGQATETRLPAITMAHEGSHLILGASDEYPDPAAPPGRAVFTDHSLLGNFYSEGISRARIKHRHFTFIIPIIQSWFPGKTITITP